MATNFPYILPPPAIVGSHFQFIFKINGLMFPFSIKSELGTISFLAGHTLRSVPLSITNQGCTNIFLRLQAIIWSMVRRCLTLVRNPRQYKVRKELHFALISAEGNWDKENTRAFEKNRHIPQKVRDCR